MNTKAFLRDWQPGDIVTAADMQALADTVAMLEADADTRGGAERGARRRISDGPQGWPWQVVALHSEDKYELRVLPGKVLAGCRMTGHGAGLGEEEVAYTYLELPATEGADVVQDYDATKDVATVYLELTGRVVRRYLTRGDMVAAGLMDDPYGMMTDADKAQRTGHEVVTLEDATLRVTCAPVDTALRIWPLAVVSKAHAQPVTQLTWGDLSALECRGIARTDGKPVWPSDRTQAAAWGTTAHADGMDAVAPVEFSTAVESIEGTLRACMDADGALEFYLGEYTTSTGGGGGSGSDAPGVDDPGGDEPWTDDPDEPGDEDPDDDMPPDGPYVPVGPDVPPDGPTPSDTVVKYGYVAGEGFARCQLVRAGDGKLYWELELDGGYLAGLCAGIKAAASVTFYADGTQIGTHSAVEMGLGECRLTATGLGMTGTAGLEFGGLDGQDVNKKSSTLRLNYTAAPSWTQTRKWYLSPEKIHKAGDYVRLEAAKNGFQPFGFVKAMKWWRFSVNGAAFRAAAEGYFRAQLGKVSVSDSDVSTSYDSTVRGELTGSLISANFNIILQGAAEE